MSSSIKPILFNKEMSLAIKKGVKTHTRRSMPIQPSDDWIPHNYGEIHKMHEGEFLSKNNDIVFIGHGICNEDGDEGYITRFSVGDTLWVREPAKVVYSRDNLYLKYKYLSDGTISGEIKIPLRFIKHQGVTPYNPDWIALNLGVPNGCIKEMARFCLKIKEVRAEKLQDITCADIIKEGFDFRSFLSEIEKQTYKDSSVLPDHLHDKAFGWWTSLWDSNAKEGHKWKDNPWVTVNVFTKDTIKS